MKHNLIILLAIILVAPSNAQSIDKERMHRDIEVAENALRTIISPANSKLPRFNIYEENIEGEYASLLEVVNIS